MGSRRHISRKLESDSTPVQHQFRTRPFGKGIQARQAELPPTNLLETRPFGVPNQGTSQQQEAPSIQTQLEQAERFGYNAANIPTFAPGTASPPPIQAKLTIGAPGDKYEQEADQVAAQVVSQINSPQTQPSSQGQSVQREGMPPAPEEEEENPAVRAKLDSSTIQREEMPVPEEEEENPAVRAKLDSGTIQREEMPVPEEEEENLAVRAKLDSSTIQREEMPAPEEEEENPAVRAKLDSSTIQRDVMSEEEKKKISPKLMVQPQSNGGTAATPDLEESIQQARGSGQPLSDNIREPMEQAFGADFSGVKIHTDTQSDQLNRSIQARAFTTGQDVFFRQGEYNPGSKGGQELIAHEFTHVLQQTGAGAKGQAQAKKQSEAQSINAQQTVVDNQVEVSTSPSANIQCLIEPVVTDNKLKNLVRDLYKGAHMKKKAPIGDGSTADAIRQEKQTGLPTGGKFHTQKGQEYKKALENWLKKNPTADQQDKDAAQAMIDDLQDALSS